MTNVPAPPAPAPNRSERAHCWEQRDEYFGCLDKIGVQQSGGAPGSEGSCRKQREGYEGACARSWIDYFNKRRTLEIRQRLTVEAAEKARDENTANIGR